MSKTKIIIPGLCLILWILTLWQMSPPTSLTSATPLQIFAFFGPLFLMLLFSLNFIFKFWLKSLIISFEIILLLVFQGLRFLNPFVFLIVAGTILVTLKFIKKQKKFTPLKVTPKIHKLSKG
jgi:hypothetical protein